MSTKLCLVDRKNGFGYRRLCNDCRRDVVRAGHWYMAREEIWKDKLGLGWLDNLCLDCLEKRLGRKLRPGIRDIGWSSTPCKFPLAQRLIEIWTKPQKRKRRRS